MCRSADNKCLFCRSLFFGSPKLENPEGVLIFNSDYFANENPAFSGKIS